MTRGVKSVGWLAAVLTLAGTAMVAHGMIQSGFAVRIFGDLAWVYYGVVTQQFSIVVAESAFAAVDIYGAI